MGNKAVIIPFLVISLLASAMLAFLPLLADASRGERPRGIPEILLKRLCDRQNALKERLGRDLVNPLFCEEEPQPEEPTVEITADPLAITEGGTSTVTWESENATSCTASNGWSGAKALEGSLEVTPSETTTYEITCSGEGGTASDSVTVTVNEPEPEDPTVTLTANPTSIAEGASSLLSWSTTNASSCEKSGGWSGATTTSGTLSVSPTETTTYELTCTGAGGSASDSVTVTVTPEPLQTITEIVVADSRFDTLEAAVVAAELADDLGSEGPFTVFAPTDDAFDALPDGVLASLLAAPTTTLRDVLLYHVVSGSLDSDEVAAVDSLETLLAGESVTVEVTDEGIMINDALIIVADIEASNGIIHIIDAVLIPPTSDPEPTVSITAAPLSVTPGEGSATTTLTWVSENATSCTASGGSFTGSKAVNGSEIVTPTATTTYAIECTGAGGSASDSVTVNFVPEAVEPTEGALVISEVLYDPSPAQGSESGHEWVEIFNGTNDTLNLSGYFLQDNSASEIFVFPQGTTLEAGASLLVTGASSTVPTASLWTVPSNASWLTFSGFSNQLANSGDFVHLFNSASSSVDAVCWGPEDDAFDCDALQVDTNSGNSIGRIDRFVDTGTVSDWQIQTPNPGE